MTAVAGIGQYQKGVGRIARDQGGELEGATHPRGIVRGKQKRKELDGNWKRQWKFREANARKCRKERSYRDEKDETPVDGGHPRVVSGLKNASSLSLKRRLGTQRGVI